MFRPNRDSNPWTYNNEASVLPLCSYNVKAVKTRESSLKGMINIIFLLLFYKSSYLNKDVNHTEPSPSARVPCTNPCNQSFKCLKH